VGDWQRLTVVEVLVLLGVDSQAVEDGVFEPIESLDGIGSVRANRFHQNGIYTIMDLAVCSPIEIKDITGLEEEAALDIVSKAKEILEKKNICK